MANKKLLSADLHSTSRFFIFHWSVYHSVTDHSWPPGGKTTSERWRASRGRRVDHLYQSAEPSEWEEWRLVASSSESRRHSEGATTSPCCRRGNRSPAIQYTLRTWLKTQLDRDSSAARANAAQRGFQARGSGGSVVTRFVWDAGVSSTETTYGQNVRLSEKNHESNRPTAQTPTHNPHLHHLSRSLM